MNYLTPVQVREYQIGVLDYFVKVCEENHLRYYLCGGTLLGAIRHKGFIPWDDDIDVFMPRPDLEALLKLTAQAPFEFRFFKLKNSLQPFVKVVNTDTLAQERNNISPTAIWIDVFPIDGVFKSKLISKLHFKLVRFLRYRTYFGLRPEALSLRAKILMGIVKFLHINPERVNRLFCRLTNFFSKIKSYDSSKIVGGVCWGYGPQEAMKKEDLEKTVLVEFEGKQYKAPSCYDTYLKNLYGDYMQLPPEEKRRSHNLKAWLREKADG